MIVKTLILGPLDTNCYLIINNNDCLIVDPADNFDFIKKQISNLNVVGILITHYHFDHIGALKQIQDYYNVPIYDYNNKDIQVSGFNLSIINNPGHTSDSVSFYFQKDKVMFVGDFIFKDCIGRTDLESGSNFDMEQSLNMIKKYDDEIILYPGHGDSTTIGYEKKNNFYLKKQN